VTPPHERVTVLDRADEASRTKGAVLVVDDDEMILALVSHGLRAAGYQVTTAESGTQALERLAEAVPDVIVSDVNMPDMDGFSLVRELRQDEALRALPLVFLTSRAEADDVVSGLGLGADDYLTKPFSLPVLVARVEAKRLRPPVPADRLRVDRRTGLSGAAAFLDELARERERAGRSGRPGHVAVLSVHEAASVSLRFGPRGSDELRRQLGDVLAGSVDALETAGLTEDGTFALLLPESDPAGVERRLQRLTESIATARPTVGGEPISITPVVGFASLEEGEDGAQALEWAGLAQQHAATHLDLRPVAYTPQMLPAYAELKAGQLARGSRPRLERLRLPLQIAVTVGLGMVVPYALYLLADRAGIDVVSVAYVVVVVSLLITGAAIWVEGLLALDPVQPPPSPPELDETAEYPPATALVAAYLPNEAATVVQTVEAFLRVDYPGGLQVVLAYNTPVDLPVEAVLARIAERDPRLVLVRVPGSTSKAQNVNAAMTLVSGHFTGVFDADHHPEPDSFRRAWRWLADGYDIVQGHPVVRNGDASWVARMGRRRVRDDLRRQSSRAREAPRIRHLRRVERLLAHGAAPPDPLPRLDDDRGHRLGAAGRAGGLPHRLRPVPHHEGARTDHAVAAVEPADALVAGLVPGLARPPALGAAQPHADAAAEVRLPVPARLARGLPVAVAADVPDRRLLPDGRRGPGLVRAGVRPHDAVHDHGRSVADPVRLSAGRSRDPQAPALVPRLPGARHLLLHGVEEPHRSRGAGQAAHAREQLEGHPAHGRDRGEGPGVVTPADVLDDPVRLRAVDDLGLLGQPFEARFDRVTRTLLRVLDVPVSLLNLVTEDAVAVVSTAGGEQVRRIGRESSFCTEVVGRQDALLVHDATTDARWATSALVTGPAGTRAYAGVPLRGPGGQVVGTLCGLDVRPRRWSDEDVTALFDLSCWAEAELARGEVERQRALGELAVARMKDELISVVSHELRTPLTSLKGALGLLTAGVVGLLPESGQELARIALENADRLARLVDEICDLERLVAGQVVLERRRHPLSELVESAVEAVSTQAEQARVVVRASVDDVTTWLDGPRISHALEHLLENAVRVSAQGSTVDVRGSSTADGVLLEVEDRGCGIDPRDLERVFGSFTRGDSSDTRAHGGTGLGLALARSVVEAHGGRLTARSAVGRGATFTVALPQRSAARTVVA
jgi:signal transduction histidine kinase/DNA-binding response OmpR family regulator